MTPLSINLPDNLAKASQEAAENLGISRTQFIRLAISHELEKYRALKEEDDIVKSFSAMKASKKYSQIANEIETDFDDDLSADGEEWWKGK